MVGEVVMVRLGAAEEGMDLDEDAEQGSSYVELKPSTTLLVPLELMQEQPSLADDAQLDLPELQKAMVTDDLTPETQSSFSLMLDLDEEGAKEAFPLPAENDLQSSDPPTQTHIVDICDELLAKPDVIPLSADGPDTLFTEASQDIRRKEMEMHVNEVDGLCGEEPVTDLLTECTAEQQDMEDAGEQKDGQFLHEDDESASLSISEQTPAEELPEAVNDKNSVTTEAVEEIEEEEKPAPAVEEQNPEENGPVDTNTEMVLGEETEADVEAEEPQEQRASTEAEITSENGKEENTQQKLQHENVEEKAVEVLSSESQPDKECIPKTPTSQRKKAPSTPTRRMTRGRAVTFISPLSEAVDEPDDDDDDDGSATDAKTSGLVPASPSRTLRKSTSVKQTQVQAGTPRRSSRKTQTVPPKEESEAIDDTSVTLTSKASSPARRSQRATATRSSQRHQGGSEKMPVATEVKGEDDEEAKILDAKVSQQTSSKTQTPSKHRTSRVITPRRSSRRTVNSSEVEQTSLEMVKEEEEQDQSVVLPITRSSRRRNTQPSETLPALLEEDDDSEQPGRTTRQSSRLTLNMYPQVRIQKAVSPNICASKFHQNFISLITT